MSKAKKSEIRGQKSGASGADEANAQQVRTEATRPLQVYAGECPRSKHHTATRVYRTVGRTRYCVCDDCGERFKRIGPAGEEAAAAEPAEV